MKEIYLTEARLLDLLARLGVKVITDTDTDFLCYCPFHYNVDSPAFNISKRSPYLWKCWNGKCEQRGNIVTLITKKGFTNQEAKRMLLEGVTDVDDFRDFIRELLREEHDADEPSGGWIDDNPLRFKDEDEAHGWPARSYLRGRGIEERAYSYFRMGFSAKRRMLVIPIFTDVGIFAGVVGRSIENKRYMYSHGLDRRHIIWNLNNSRSFGGAIALTEGALDSVYIWQTGFESVGAVFGSDISPEQLKLIRTYFTEIICFFDNDDAGKALSDSLCRNVFDMAVSVVEYPDRLIPAKDKAGNDIMRPVKDPGELTQEEIKNMIDNRKSSLELLF